MKLIVSSCNSDYVRISYMAVLGPVNNFILTGKVTLLSAYQQWNNASAFRAVYLKNKGNCGIIIFA